MALVMRTGRIKVNRHGWLAAILFLFMAGLAGKAMAQSPEDLLRQYRERAGVGTPQTVTSPVDRARSQQELLQQQMLLEPEGPYEPSRIELDYRERLGQIIEQDEEEEDDEDRMAERAGEEAVQPEIEKDTGIRQFGYDMFRPRLASLSGSTGRIADSYILGIGDQIVVSFVGSTERTVVTQVDREGRVVLPEIGPVNAVGRTFGAFQSDLRNRVSSALLGTNAYVSVGDVRQVAVYVLGEVKYPGQHNILGLSNVVDALTQAGIKRTGSLRAIRLEAPGISRTLDIYDLLTTGAGANLQIKDGMRIIVPPIGSTVAVAGEVLRPAIYELSSDQPTINAAELLTLAGGTLRPVGNDFVANEFQVDGRQVLSTLAKLDTDIPPGTILSVQRRKNVIRGKVTLVGHVGVEGERSLESAPTLSALIGGPDGFGPAPYLLFAVLETKDARTQSKLMKAVNLERVLAGVEDVALRDEDSLYVLSAADVEFLSSAAVRNAVLTSSAGENNCEAVTELGEKLTETDLRRYSAVVRSVFVTSADEGEEKRAATTAARSRLQTATTTKSESEAESIASGEALVGQAGVLSLEEVGRAEAKPRGCSELFDDYAALLPFTLEHAASVTGAARRPGVYPIAGKTSLSSVAAVSGGFANNADVRNIEILTFSDLSLEEGVVPGRRYVDAGAESLDQVNIVSGSSIRFNSVVSDQEPGTVLLTGEVLRPGVYSISRGETLGEIIERAGGLTEFAYPYGAQLTRVSVKREQQEGFRRAARELNSALASAVLRRNLDAEALTAAQQLAESLATVEAPGRVVIEADPAVLRTRPELDTVLEPGDTFHMPKRPNFVVVAGDVLNPGALQFIPGKEVEDYIGESGGLQAGADDDRVFLVYPNGVAEPVNISRWAFSSVQVPPGSTVVVPKKTSPLPLEVLRDVSSIFGNLALAAASLAVVVN